MSEIKSAFFVAVINFQAELNCKRGRAPSFEGVHERELLFQNLELNKGPKHFYKISQISRR
jgi:hypothetical protein